jgi:DNA recombination protein RmuC
MVIMEVVLDILEIIIIILLLALIAFFVWDRSQTRRRRKEQEDALSKAVGERLDGTIQVFGDLREKLGELTQRTRYIEEVGKSISSLQEILRAPKFRGGFGEMMLERLLADILPAENYALQHRFRNGEAVDAVISIGGNLVPVDSKFPMEDFQRMVATDTEKEQSALRRQFIRTVKKHIDDVAKYIRPDEKTFDFALMYVPAENVYYETVLKSKPEDDDICSYALGKRVVPVSPNSFYAYLQALLLGLNGLRIEKEAREILGQLNRLQGDLSNFQADYETLGAHLEHAARKYEDGRRKLSTLATKLQLTCETPAKKLPETSTKE